MASLTVQQIRWGTGLADTIYIAYPSRAVTYGVPASDFDVLELASGYRTAWGGGASEQQRLREDVRYIPPADTVDPLATGWDGVKGWRAFLAWARRQNTFTHHRDARNFYRFAPMSVDSNGDGLVDGHAIFRSIASTSYAKPAGRNQVVTATFTGAGQVAGVESLYRPPAWAGMPTRFYSIDARFNRAPGATAGSLLFTMRREFLDAAAASLGFAYITLATDPSNDTNYIRFTVSDATAAPAGTVAIRLSPCLRSAVDASATGSTVEMKDIAVQYGGSAFEGYVDSDLSVLSYLDAPLRDAPGLEDDGTRRLTLELISASGASYDGY
jgi:hypothetical protein